MNRRRLQRPVRRAQTFSRSNGRRWLAIGAALAALLMLPLLARAQAAPDSVKLSWTAPGDDGSIGTATAYDVRYSTATIDLSNWGAATQASNLPAPKAAGSAQSVTVHGLTNGQTYYFAVRTQDDAGNWSGISNVLQWNWVLDTSPPAAPSGVSSTRDPSDVHLHWSPNSEPDLAGYNVYRATTSGGAYTKLNSALLSAVDYYDSTVPGSASQVWYQVTAADHSGNVSARSATTTVTFTTTAAAPTAWSLETGYPNPSHLANSVTIPVVIPGGGGGGSLVISDDSGHRVRELPLAGLAAGRRLVTWDGKNESGLAVAPGVYHLTVFAGGARANARIVRVP